MNGNRIANHGAALLADSFIARNRFFARFDPTPSAVGQDTTHPLGRIFARFKIFTVSTATNFGAKVSRVAHAVQYPMFYLEFVAAILACSHRGRTVLGIVFSAFDRWLGVSLVGGRARKPRMAPVIFADTAGAAISPVTATLAYVSFLPLKFFAAVRANQSYEVHFCFFQFSISSRIAIESFGWIVRRKATSDFKNEML